jgi:primosomal protein N' (replication factor Y)
VQALIRWDPVNFSERELAERAELGFPPAVRMASVTGASDAVADFVGSVGLPDQAEVLGPVPADTFPARNAGHPQQPAEPPEPQERALIRISRREGLALARALHAAQATRSARKDGAAVRVQLDPAEVA